MIPQGHTPTEITKKIEHLAKTLGSSPPALIPIQPSPTAKPNNCHQAVDEHVAQNGGTKVMGWKIWRTPYWFKAVYHAVWRSPDGELIDITPEREESMTLFVVDNTKRPSVYVPPHIFPTKNRYKKLAIALSKIDKAETQMNEMNETVNQGGTVPRVGKIDSATAWEMGEAQMEFIDELNKAQRLRVV